MNRSPSGYLNNPAEERSKYRYNVDKEMTLVKFVDDEFGPVGSFNWFATHGTSMSRTNSLISGDNKGAAARFMEDWAEQNGLPKQTGHANSVEFGPLHLPRRVSTIIPEPDEISMFHPSCLVYLVCRNEHVRLFLNLLFSPFAFVQLMT